MSINIGIDLCDEYISAYLADSEKILTVPTMVCREKKEDIWHIGEEAYRLALSGKGVLTEKLLSLLLKGGTSTIQRKSYSAEALLSKLIGTVLTDILKPHDIKDVGRLVICLKHPDKREMDSLLRSALLAGVERKKITIISHEESFVHYMLSRERELIFNLSGLFDLSGETLSFYRLKVVRGNAKNMCIIQSDPLKEKFRIGIINNEQGSEIGDQILLNAAKKYMANDIYSSVILTGKGFENTAWAENFIKFICKKRRVIYEESLFAVGAALYCDRLGLEDSSARTEDDYLIFCDTRTRHRISLDVIINERKAKLILVPQGALWYDVDTYAEVLPKGQRYIDLDIEAMDRAQPKKSIRLPLDGFPSRPDRCTRISVEINYEDASTINIKLKDLGFGEIFPSSGKTLEKTVNL